MCFAPRWKLGLGRFGFHGICNDRNFNEIGSNFDSMHRQNARKACFHVTPPHWACKTARWLRRCVKLRQALRNGRGTNGLLAMPPRAKLAAIARARSRLSMRLDCARKSAMRPSLGAEGWPNGRRRAKGGSLHKAEIPPCCGPRLHLSPGRRAGPPQHGPQARAAGVDRQSPHLCAAGPGCATFQPFQLIGGN